MSKKGPLNKIETYYIKNNPENLSVEDLAKELDRSKSSVEKIYETKAVTEVKTTASQVQNLMGKAKNKGKVVGAVMTEAASAMSDGLRKRRGPTRYMRDGTTKIHD